MEISQSYLLYILVYVTTPIAYWCFCPAVDSICKDHVFTKFQNGKRDLAEEKKKVANILSLCGTVSVATSTTTFRFFSCCESSLTTVVWKNCINPFGKLFV